MKIVSIEEAKTHLARLIKEAVAGSPFIIAMAGKPLVTVTALQPKPQKRRLGFLAGQIVVPDDFDQMGAETIADLFEGVEAEPTNRG